MMFDSLKVKDLSFYGISQEKDYLFIGHPRFGSGYLSSVLINAGIKIGHERVYQNGSASWMYVVDDLCYPYGDSMTYHKYFFRNVHMFIRDPLRALPSCIVENSMVNSYNFRRKHILKTFQVDLESFKNDVDRAAASIIYWYKMCELKRPASYVKIDNKSSVKELITRLGIDDEVLVKKALETPARNTAEMKWGNNFPGKVKPVLDAGLINEMSDNVREALFCLCNTYGYNETARELSV